MQLDYLFSNTLKSVEFMSLSSSEATQEEATSGYVPGIHRSLVIVDSSGEKWLVKPAKDEHVTSWRKIPPNRCYVREVAAYIISKEMKIGLVPETKLVVYDGDIGSAQKWVDATPFKSMDEFSALDVWLAGIFDLITANSDRHRQNILVSKPIVSSEPTKSTVLNTKHIVLIDNGYSLPFSEQDPKANIINSRFAYEIFGKTLPTWVRELIKNTPWDEVLSDLESEKLFGKNSAAVDLLKKRIEYILESDKAVVKNFKVYRRILKK